MSVVLLSGGLDSAVCLWRANAELALSVDYGQPHVIELEYAEKLAALRGVPYRRVMMPQLPKVDDLVFAGRNAILLSLAAAHAQADGIRSVVIGCNADDKAEFPDCRVSFLNSIQGALGQAYGVDVRYPLAHHKKADVVRLAREVGVPVGQTWTCYRTGLTPCGECYACKVREEAGA